MREEGSHAGIVERTRRLVGLILERVWRVCLLQSEFSAVSASTICSYVGREKHLGTCVRVGKRTTTQEYKRER
jgi:hypothetical protein